MARTSLIAQELRQTRPFRSKGQEATLTLLRTASVIKRALERVVEPAGLSLASYNALRIIRGAGPDGIATLCVRDRMIEEGSTITRLVDKLEAGGLIRRERAEPDRRQVLCYVTARGRQLLDGLDPKVDTADVAVMEALGAGQQEQLIRLLDAVRQANAEQGAPRAPRSAAV
ncbi:MAG: MarR family transcriptional regulator [Gemmatimonadales bacterium]